MKIIIHIGQQKTGSTVLQDYLFQSRSFLDENDILYPKSLGHKKQVKLLTENAELNLEKSDISNNFEQEVNSKKYNSIIISEENLFAIDELKIKNIRNLLVPFSQEVIIFAYLRRQDDHLLSIYQQGVRGTKTNTLRETIDNFNYNNQHDYEAIIQKWASVFSNAKIILKPYVDIKNGTIVQDFNEMFDLPIYDNYKLPSLAVSNKSFDAPSIEFIRIMNSLECEGKLNWDHTLKRKMRVYLKNKPRNIKLQLSGSDVQKIKEKYIKGNNNLAKKYNNTALGKYLSNFPVLKDNNGYYNEDVINDSIYELYFNVLESLE